MAWIAGERLDVYPPALSDLGVCIEKVLFVIAGRHSVWAACELLRSNLFGMVVLENFFKRSGEERTEWELRQLQLAAESSNTALVFLSDVFHKLRPWSFSLQFSAKRSQRGLEKFVSETCWDFEIQRAKSFCGVDTALCQA